MACIQYPRKERGGVSLPSWEQPTIYREPPKEVFTRKKERIEEGDVTYNIRNDASRYNDAIMTYSKGQNAMVEVDYQNRGFNSMTTMNFGSASNPYKVNESFRPPEFRLEDLEPLSRQRRDWVGARTNPGSDLTRDDYYRENQVDQHEVAFATGAQHTYHSEQTNLSKEQGLYFDNPEMKHTLNEKYVTQNIISKLKGFDSVELQKMFQYQQTPNGIVITPMAIEAMAALSGAKDYEAQRNVSDQQSYLSDPLRFTQQTTIAGMKNYEAQRNISDEQSYLSDPLRFTQQTTIAGMKNYEAQRNISDEQSYLSDPLRFTQQTTIAGMKDYESGRQVDVGHTVVADPLRYAQQSGVKGAYSKQEYLDIQKEKVKDVLLKNMNSNVSIVIQTGGEHDGQNINASIEDKINLVIQSALGQPISLQRDDGQPVRVKDYTWKFVKSATGSDTFVIHADMPEMTLDRKSELYAAQANISHNIHVPIMSNVDLKMERINTSAQTNLQVQANDANRDRGNPELMVRAEKETNYTDWTIQSTRPTLDRVDISNLRSDKKQHLNRSFVSEMDGRFNV